jgi:hypothetical protein
MEVNQVVLKAKSEQENGAADKKKLPTFLPPEQNVCARCPSAMWYAEASPIQTKLAAFCNVLKKEIWDGADEKAKVKGVTNCSGYDQHLDQHLTQAAKA